MLATIILFAFALSVIVNKNNIVYSIDDYSIGSKLNHIEGVKYIEGDVNTIKSKIDNDFDINFLNINQIESIEILKALQVHYMGALHQQV